MCLEFLHSKTREKLLIFFHFRPFVALIFTLIFSVAWNSSLRAVINRTWLLTKHPLSFWQLLSAAPPPSTQHLLGGISARKHCLSDARNKFACHIDTCSSESKSLIVQLPPLAAWQQRWVRYAINLSHLTADSAGYPPSTPLFYFVPGSDMSFPCENKPEIWSGREWFKIEAPGCLNLICI